MDVKENIDLAKLRECDRVSTPENMKQKCYDLCKHYLSGVWNQISLEMMRFERIRGGLTNQIYFCALPDHIDTTHSNPNEVLIKFYERKHTQISNDHLNDGNERFNDNMIALFTALCGIGPKIYGVFRNGIIMQFIKGRTLDLLGKDNQNSILLGQIARKLAHIHSLKIPIEKRPNSFFELMQKYLEEGKRRFPLEELLRNYNCVTTLGTDFSKEIQFLQKYVNDCKSPVVFSHNDFRSANILIEGETDYKLTFIDFEYSSYTFRAMDLGIFFTEFNRISLLFPQFPDTQIVIDFLKEYREESIKIFGQKYEHDKQNSLEKLFTETKISYIFQILYMVLFCIKSGDEIGLGLSKEFLLVNIKISEFDLVQYLIYDDFCQDMNISEKALQDLTVIDRS